MRFQITYCDPETGEEKTRETQFDDTLAHTSPNGLKIPAISAREWAEDLAYSLADKGPYVVEEIK